MNVGAGWGGGRRRLLINVLRSERSFKGMAIMDFNPYGHIKNQSLTTGDDMQLTVAVR